MAERRSLTIRITNINIHSRICPLCNDCCRSLQRGLFIQKVLPFDEPRGFGCSEIVNSLNSFRYRSSQTFTFNNCHVLPSSQNKKKCEKSLASLVSHPLYLSIIFFLNSLSSFSNKSRFSFVKGSAPNKTIIKNTKKWHLSMHLKPTKSVRRSEANVGSYNFHLVSDTF